MAHNSSVLSWSDLSFWGSGTWKNIKNLLDRVDPKYICPWKPLIFRSLVLTPLHKVKVVIVGQDPYPTRGMADGLAFSTWKTRKAKEFPRSLQNIFSELVLDEKIPEPQTGSLVPWAKQGVLLLNTHLTCPVGESLGHDGFGWDELTKEILEYVTDVNPNCVFILWGKEAQKFADPVMHQYSTFVLDSAHPSPLSATRGFFGSKPFSKTNQFLISTNQSAIDWRIP